jgi:hypothetical protein
MIGLVRTAIALILFAVPFAPALAQNNVPSCYTASGIGLAPPAPRHATFVFVDQSTGLDARLRNTIESNLRRRLRPGSTFTIATFSAYGRGHYATILASGAIEETVSGPERRNVSVRRLNSLDACLRRQLPWATALAVTRLAQATNVSASAFFNSEIMGSLGQLAGAVRAAGAPDRLVIIASDLLEFSTATSFYRNRSMRRIDPAVEIRLAARNRLIADFAGARVAVIGAGLLPPQSGGAAIRDVHAMNALRAFWEEWFLRSRAHLVAYGQPDLVAPID